MAQRSNHAQLITEVRRLMGEPDASLSPQLPDTRVTEVLNRKLQSLPALVSEFVGVERGELMLPMWRNTWVSTATDADDTLLITAGSSSVRFPTNLDQIEWLWDRTAQREIFESHNLRRDFSPRDINVETGPPEAYELSGFGTVNSRWRLQASLFPRTPAGVTPAVTLQGWRLPAEMAGTDTQNEYPDIDLKYENLPIYLTVEELMGPEDARSALYAQKSRVLLAELAATAEYKQ